MIGRLKLNTFNNFISKLKSNILTSEIDTHHLFYLYNISKSLLFGPFIALFDYANQFCLVIQQFISLLL